MVDAFRYQPSSRLTLWLQSPVSRSTKYFQVCRLILAAAAVASLGVVAYASLVPLNYSAKSWSATYERFQGIRWFQLGIELRADWVANGLIMVPPGFLAAGAIDWRRTQRRWLMMATPFIIALLIAVVLAIEFVQIWFPPRVVSQNDIFAGVIGSIVGVVFWWVVGRTTLDQVERLLLLPAGLKKWKLLVNFSVVGLLVYNTMPLDVMISFDELRTKWEASHLRLIPFQDFAFDRKSFLLLAIAGARLAPFALLTTLQNGMRTAVLQGTGLAVLLEIVKFPIYSRPASVTNMIATAAGVVAIAFVINTLSAQRVMRWLAAWDRSCVWLVGAMGWTVIVLLGFLARFDSIEHDPAVIAQRMRAILVVPFARAHASSEFEAGENILVKIAVFGALTFLLCGWCTRCRSAGVARIAVVASCLGCLLLGVGIEIAQAFLPPLVPDATDFLLYAFGAGLGMVGFRMLIPPKSACPLCAFP